jgi:type II secretion system protein N
MRARRGLLALAVLALLLLFLAARFPWDRLLPPLVAAARAATGAELRVERLGLGFGLGGPRAVARGVSLRWPDGSALALEQVSARPAWSLAWLRGEPLWRVEASGAPGAWRGELGAGRLAGELSSVEVDALPWILVGAAAPLKGRVSGDIDLRRENGAWRGSARLAGEPGSVELPGLPVAIPYEHLRVDLALDPELVTVSLGRIEGPLVTANVGGTATAAAGSFAVWPLELRVDIEKVDPALGSYLGPLGIPLDAHGHASMKVTGSLSAPFLSGVAR